MKRGKNKVNALFICYIIAAICFYLSAILGFTDGDGSDAVLPLCLGAASTCIASLYYTRGKKGDGGDDGDGESDGNNPDGDCENKN